MDLNQIRQFFNDRPAISKRAIAKEAGISRQYLNYILNGDRPLTKATIEKMQPVLSKYGLQHRKQKKVQGNLDTKAREVKENKIPGAIGPERKGIGMEKAHEAIAVLKQIPPNDDLLQEGYDIVIQWIEYNR